MQWLEPAPHGSAVCGGFDGSVVGDWTVIRMETVDGYMFTPRYGPERRPTIWNPADWGGRIPRDQVYAAWEELSITYDIERVYCDPPYWTSEIGDWNHDFGEVFIEWHTQRDRLMHEVLELFVTDVGSKRIKHDGCPVTTQHIGNARMVARNGRYILRKPSETQKIDAAVTSALCHKAAVDARASGWGLKKPSDTRVFCFS